MTPRDLPHSSTDREVFNKHWNKTEKARETLIKSPSQEEKSIYCYGEKSNSLQSERQWQRLPDCLPCQQGQSAHKVFSLGPHPQLPVHIVLTSLPLLSLSLGQRHQQTWLDSTWLPHHQSSISVCSALVVVVVVVVFFSPDRPPHPPHLEHFVAANFVCAHSFEWMSSQHQYSELLSVK